jgi:hypothetical protein
MTSEIPNESKGKTAFDRSPLVFVKHRVQAKFALQGYLSLVLRKSIFRST